MHTTLKGTSKTRHLYLPFGMCSRVSMGHVREGSVQEYRLRERERKIPQINSDTTEIKGQDR